MKTVTGEKVITCIMPHGRALPVLEALKEELGILATTIHHARGTGRMTPLVWPARLTRRNENSHGRESHHLYHMGVRCPCSRRSRKSSESSPPPSITPVAPGA